MREPAARDWVQPGPEIVARMQLKKEPEPGTVAHYVMGRGARRAWEALNRQLGEARGALFWVGGDAGCGKTHFLNYAAALGRRAGSMNAEPARHLTIVLEAEGRKAGELEHRLLEAFMLELAGESQAPNLWRELGGVDAIGLALEQARRQGVRSLSMIIDFGLSEVLPAFDFLQGLCALARTVRSVRLIAMVAGRGVAPPGVESFEVAPGDHRERLAAMIGRARELREPVSRLVQEAYRGVEIGEFLPDELFPFHPETVKLLHLLAGEADLVATMAMLARESIIAWKNGDTRRLIYPADLMEASQSRARIEARLGDPARAALTAAHAAANLLLGGARPSRANESASHASEAEMSEREAARQIVATLALRQLAGEDARLSLEAMATLVPALRSAEPPVVLESLLTALAAATGGVVVYERHSRSARFDARAGGASELAAFNAALPLLHYFDAAMMEVNEASELQTSLKQSRDAMAYALEAACRARETLAGAMAECNACLTAEQERTVADYIAIAEAGTDNLIELAQDQPRHEAALKIFAAYEALAALAEVMPRAREMRAYLHATGLVESPDEGVSDNPVSQLAVASKLLLVDLAPATLAASSRKFEVIQARFAEFKGRYTRYYHLAHERWCAELERLSTTADELGRHLEALRRLNMIAALGAPEGLELFVNLKALDARLIHCDADAAFEGPRCPRCTFVLGWTSPNQELAEMMEQVRRPLRNKLAALSQSAIARLIREHDYNHRLEGFLKITQAAQTEALVRVLDDNLARYLGRLLDENMTTGHTGNGEVRRLGPSRLRRGRAKMGNHERAVNYEQDDDS
ncbi:MAG: hypothetical protein ACREQE_00305 [Candidatus Binataceae bacterium]